VAPLGMASFATGTVNFQNATALKQVSSLPWGANAAVYKQPAMSLFTAANAPDKPDVLKAQTLAIQKAVGADPRPGQQVLPSPQPPPGGLAVLTLILVETE